VPTLFITINGALFSKVFLIAFTLTLEFERPLLRGLIINMLGSLSKPRR
jgi:hypothetical protein